MAGLLISVSDATEALVAVEAGAAIIDVKEPQNGPLGRADESALEAVLQAVAGRAPVSAALGELRDWAEERLPPCLERLAFVKWGLAGAGTDWTTRWRRLRERVESVSSCRAVMTAYADWRRVAAPPPSEVFHAAFAERAAALLIDTGVKDGTTLTDWLAVGELDELARRCRETGMRLALAGALGATAIRGLLGVRPDWFAVRGAACRQGRREGPVDAECVRRLTDLLAGRGR